MIYATKCTVKNEAAEIMNRFQPFFTVQYSTSMESTFASFFTFVVLYPTGHSIHVTNSGAIRPRLETQSGTTGKER